MREKSVETFRGLSRTVFERIFGRIVNFSGVALNRLKSLRNFLIQQLRFEDGSFNNALFLTLQRRQFVCIGKTIQLQRSRRIRQDTIFSHDSTERMVLMVCINCLNCLSFYGRQEFVLSNTQKCKACFVPEDTTINFT